MCWPVLHYIGLQKALGKNFRDSHISLALEKAMSGDVPDAALKEDPVALDRANFRLNFGEHSCAEPRGALLRRDHHVLKKREAPTRRLSPTEDCNSAQISGLVARNEKLALLSQSKKVRLVQASKVTRPALEVGCQARLDLTMTDVGRIERNYVSGELGGYACSFRGLVPGEGDPTRRLFSSSHTTRFFRRHSAISLHGPCSIRCSA